MSKRIFHPSLECVQHGGKVLVPPKGTRNSLLTYASKAGCEGVQLSHFHLLGDNGFESKETVKDALEKVELRLDGISCHCLTWVHGSAWTGTPCIKKFIPQDVQAMSLEKIEAWAETKLIQLMDLSVSLGNYLLPMFWGTYWGLEVASGYPWGMWDISETIDLIDQGRDRFLLKTQKLRKEANDRGMVFAHEIHPGSAALCGEDFMDLVRLSDDDPCLGVNGDPSHCWANEDPETRFRLVAPYVAGCHVKDHKIVSGRSTLSMQLDWRKRGMYFCGLGEGDLDIPRYVEQMVEIGYPERFRKIQKLPLDATVPLVGEAESAYRDLDETADQATKYLKQFCGSWAEGSFEDAMKA